MMPATVPESTPTTAASQSLSAVFAALRAKSRIGLLPFIPAGYPDLAATAELLPALELGGASAVEIGIPFSDPIADGPIIQEAFNQALTRKIHVRQVFDTIHKARPNVTIPLVAMVSFSIVFRYGVDKSLADSRGAGFNGL